MGDCLTGVALDVVLLADFTGVEVVELVTPDACDGLVFLTTPGVFGVVDAGKLWLCAVFATEPVAFFVAVPPAGLAVSDAFFLIEAAGRVFLVPMGVLATDVFAGVVVFTSALLDPEGALFSFRGALLTGVVVVSCAGDVVEAGATFFTGDAFGVEFTRAAALAVLGAGFEDAIIGFWVACCVPP